jgi:hypothetical protein
MQLRGNERAILQVVYNADYTYDAGTCARLATACAYLVLQRFLVNLSLARHVSDPEDFTAIDIAEYVKWLDEDPDPVDVFLGVGVHRSLVPVHVAHLRTALALVMGQGRMVLRFYEANDMPYGSGVQGLSAWLRSDTASGCVSMLMRTLVDEIDAASSGANGSTTLFTGTGEQSATRARTDTGTNAARSPQAG